MYNIYDIYPYVHISAAVDDNFVYLSNEINL